MNRLFLLPFGMVTFVVHAHAQVPDYVPTEGLVAWYNLDGNALDGSGNGFHGEIYGPSPSENRFGQPESSLDFRREELDHITTGIDNIVGDGDRSVALWVRINDGRLGGFVLSYGPELFESTCNAGFHIDAWMGDCEFVGVGVGSNCYQRRLPFEQLDDNSWHHIAITYSGGGLANTQYWFDGVLQLQAGCTQGSLPSVLNTTTLFGMSIGKRNDNNVNSYFDGLVDDVGVFNVALTPDEILALYNAPAPVTGCTDPTACNYDAEVNEDDGSCIPSGCIEPLACNYNALAECEGEACDYTCCPGPGCCADGTSWHYGLEQCVESSSNSNATSCGPGTYWDELDSLCLPIETCENDLDGDGVIGVNDLMQLLSSFGTDCPDSWTCGDPVTYHGYDYATVQIGEQCWFAENLRAENYRNGEAIPLVVNDIDWDNINGDAVRCSAAPYAHPDAGQLYTYFVVSDERGVCPSDWHVPSHEEWIALELELGLDPVELENWGESRGNLGLKMKSCLEWNGDCSMQSGFNAVYSSVRPGNGPEDGDYSAEEVSAFWSSTPDVGAWYRSLSFNSSGIHAWYDGDGGDAGYSIRCLKDQ